MQCRKCGSQDVRKDGFKYNHSLKRQQYVCKSCNYHWVDEPVNIESQPEESNMITEENLRQKHDMFFAVKSFIDTIPSGKFIDELSLLRQVGIAGKPRYRDAISRPELKECKGKVDGVIYYGHSDSIRKLKQEGILQ